MDDISEYIVKHIITAYAMLVFWCIFFLAVVKSALRVKLYELLIVAAGAIPAIIFYIYRILDVFGPWEHALYMRLVLLSLGSSILLTALAFFSRRNSDDQG